MAVVKTNVPMTSGLCCRTIDSLTEIYPFCRSEVLTRTAYGRPVKTLVIGTGPRRVLFTAAYHGNEWITATLLLKFMEELAAAVCADGKLWGVNARTITELNTIHIVPMVNPDGVDLVTGAIAPGSREYLKAEAMARSYPGIPFPDGWKANLMGVDLNLQYPAGWLNAREIKFSQGYDRPGPRDYVGRAPLSQKESRALAAYTDRVDPALVLAFHTQGRVIYWQYGENFIPGAGELAAEFARVSGYSVEDTPYASSFAGYKDWFIQEFRRPGFTIEAGRGVNPLPISQLDTIYRENLGILVTAALGLPGGV